jgi:hypothetical protein
MQKEHAHVRAMWGTNHKSGQEKKKVLLVEMKHDVKHFV